MIQLPLSNQEAVDLHNLLAYVCHPRRVDEDSAALVRVLRKLKRHTPDVLCEDCGERPAERNKRCQKCEMRRRRAS